MRTIGLVAMLMVFAATPGGRGAGCRFTLPRDRDRHRQGRGEPAAGFRLCMEDVIVRVSGDYTLVTSGKAATTVADAAKLVTDFRYRDRLEGIPIHDEQGSYARPHDLTVDFDHAKVDAALAAMGSRPWLAPRPRLVVFLGVRNATGTFMLSADGDQGFYMRDSFNAASDRIAIPIALPTCAEIGGLNSTPRRSSRPIRPCSIRLRDEAAATRRSPERWCGATPRSAGSPTWRLLSGGEIHEWRVSGVSFDEAFRNALRGAAQVLSGNGQPKG